jgi:subtilisin-like proprotein convertase family protein
MRSTLILLFSLFQFYLVAQSFHSAQDETTMRSNANWERQIIPQKYDLYAFDIEGLTKYLNENRSGNSFSLELPTTEGNGQYNLTYDPVMQDKLAAKYPELMTFSGTNNETGGYIRLAITPDGLSAVFQDIDGQANIDPWAKGQNTYHTVYKKKDYVRNDIDSEEFTCLSEGEHEVNISEQFSGERTIREGAVVDFRTYELAIATTAEYSNYHGGTVELVMAEVVKLINKINFVFNIEMAAKLEMVDGNDQLFFFDAATDGYSNGNPSNMISENITIINSIIGLPNYDMGHVLGKALGGGVVGLAGLSVICTQSKARAMSSLFNPIGDNFYVDIVAHEMGHQFSATHTFNNCSGNESPGTAFEPGGGTTIMSYAGSCGGNNIQGLSDDYYHVASLEQMHFFITQGSANNCPDKTPEVNTAPEVWVPMPEGLTIPIRTPFKVWGHGEDAEGDVITYCWEEYDLGPQSPLGAPIGNAPTFRSLPPSLDSFRTFPNYTKILTGQPSPGEDLPTKSRDLSFKLTLRDNNPDGGGVTISDKYELSVDSMAGPFRITSPAGIATVEAGVPTEITWSVNNTDLEPINATHINILFSNDNGTTFPYTLACETANDGSEMVIFPDILTTHGRIMIVPVGNIFFDVSRSIIKVVEPTDPGIALYSDNCLKELCLPDMITFSLDAAGIGGYADSVFLNIISDIPQNANIQLADNSLIADSQTELLVDLTAFDSTLLFEIIIEAVAPGVETVQYVYNIQSYSNNYEALDFVYPANGEIGVPERPVFEWTDNPNAHLYNIQISTTPIFGPSDIVLERFNIDVSEYQFNSLIEPQSIYYWRIQPINECGPGPFGKVGAFSTVNANCSDYSASDLPIFISGSGTPEIQSSITINDSYTISDINVNHVRGSHQFFKDLEIAVVNPSMDTVTLFKNRSCGGGSFDINFDDAAPGWFNCGNKNDGVISWSLSPLDVMNGKQAQGQWKLIVKDNKSGDSGELEGWSLQVCSNSSTVGFPFIVTTNTLHVDGLDYSNLTKSILEVGDDNNTPEEISIIVLNTPKYGDLKRNGIVLNPGDIFTQAEINNQKIAYRNTVVSSTPDILTFAAYDPDNGFVGNINIDVEISPVGTKDLDTSIDIQLFPNPAMNSLYMVSSDNIPQLSDIRIFDQNGKLIKTMDPIAAGRTVEIDISSMKPGMYFINTNDQKSTYTFRFIKL